MITISPSLLAANFACLQEELTNMKNAGADMLHLDVMDGHFVPNISFGMPVISSLRKISDLLFDVHIMISNPLDYIDDLKNAGADMITFHLEANGDPKETIDKIRSLGLAVGMSISPDTDVNLLLPYIQYLDLVLIMTVVPGFGGQKFRADMMPKIRAVCEKAKELGKEDMYIQVDGGIARDTIAVAAENGANCFVVGSALFGKEDYTAEIIELKSLAQAK